MRSTFKIYALLSSGIVFLGLFWKTFKRRGKLVEKLRTTRKKKSLSPTEIQEIFEKNLQSEIETLNSNEKLLKKMFIVGKTCKFNKQDPVEYFYHLKRTTHIFTKGSPRVRNQLISSNAFKMVDYESDSSLAHGAFVSVHQNPEIECLLAAEMIKEVSTPVDFTFIENLGLFFLTSIYFVLQLVEMPLSILKDIFIRVDESEFALRYGSQVTVYGDVIYNFKDHSLKIEHPLKFLSNSSEVLLKRIQNKLFWTNFKMVGLIGLSLLSFGLAMKFYKKSKYHPYKQRQNQIAKLIVKEKNIITLGKDFRCIVCRSKQKSIILQPCSHLVMCKECLEKNDQKEHNCPLCKERYSDSIEILIP